MEIKDFPMKGLIAGLLLILSAMALSLIKVEASGVELLFAYEPRCPHCEYQIPVIRRFESAYPEVRVTCVRYRDLNGKQKELIKGTRGHPVMVFYTGNCMRQVVGETSEGDLKKEYEAFKNTLEECLKSTTGMITTTGSGAVCY